MVPGRTPVVATPSVACYPAQRQSLPTVCLSDVIRTLAIFGLVVMGALSWSAAAAGPWIDPGDWALRHDLRLLADAGVVSAPMMAWPIPWGSVVRDVTDLEDRTGLSEAESAALDRVEWQIGYETRVRELVTESELSVMASPMRTRNFLDTPRSSAETKVKVDWIGEHAAGRLAITAAKGGSVDDGKLSGDGSYLALALGNWIVAVGAADRWWGPGWDDSLVLSNNARPIPALSVQRNFPDPFDTRWLRWLGPWSTSVMLGRLEGGRKVPNSLFLGWQFHFKPLPGLEVGLERTAIGCGRGRTCDIGTLGNLLVGRDGAGGDAPEGESCNRLTGVSVRYVVPSGHSFIPHAIYGQTAAEHGSGPGRGAGWLGLVGVEYLGRWGGNSLLVYVEATDTTCNFAGNRKFDCAYGHAVYEAGYRYRGRNIGSSFGGDAGGVSLGGLVITRRGHEWGGVLRHARLNRGGGTQPVLNGWTGLTNLEVFHRRDTRWGRFELGGGVDRLHPDTGRRRTDVRGYFRWRRDF